MKTTIKETLKKEAKELREYKVRLKEAQRNKTTSTELNQWKLQCKKSDWRHKHIAYCLLKGKKIEEIERKVRRGNEHNPRIVEELIQRFSRHLDTEADRNV